VANINLAPAHIFSRQLQVFFSFWQTSHAWKKRTVNKEQRQPSLISLSLKEKEKDTKNAES